MQRWVILCAILGAGGCWSKPHESFDRNRFAASTLQMALAHGEIGALAMKRARHTETRNLAGELERDQRVMFAELASIAQRRGIAPPRQLEQKRVALVQNLSILPGQVFDRGYLLAVAQDLEALEGALRAAGSSGDADLEAFARRHTQRVERQQKQARALLDRFGGSPFGFVP